MPYAHRVNRVTMSGTSFGGEEEWSTGFFLGAANQDADAPTEELADAIAALWQTFFTAQTSGIGTLWKCTEVKIAALGTDGKTVPDSPVYSTYPAPISGGNTTNPTFPAQIAMVATLVAPVARGLASKGRMYLPGVVTPVDANGRISDTARQNITNNLRLFLRGVVDSPLTVNVPVLASQGRAVAGGTAPITRQIESVRVGNVYDTQRRRRNALTEAYSTAVV